MDLFVKAAEAGEPVRGAFLFDCHGHFGADPGFHIPASSADAIVAGMDRLGLDMVAISAIMGVAPEGNGIVAQVLCAHPDRFVGYARVNANYSKGIRAELERCFDSPGFKGIKIHPYCDQVRLDDPRYEPVWEFSSARGAPVLIHTWNSLRYADALLDYSLPARVVKVAERHPGAKIIIGHSGGEYDGIMEAVPIAGRFPNVYLDTASSRLYPGVIEMMVREVGAEKVLYGSDVPFLTPVTQLGKVIHADIPESDKRKILGLNAAALFGVSPRGGEKRGGGTDGG